MKPAKFNLTGYKNDTLPVSITIKDTAGDPFPMEFLGDLSVRIFRQGREAQPMYEPSLTVVANHIVFEVTPLQTGILAAQGAFWELRSEYQDRVVTLISGAVPIVAAHDKKGTSAIIVTAIIDTGLTEISLVVDATAALAMNALQQTQALAAAFVIPGNTVIVDHQYEGSIIAGQVGNIDQALLFARAFLQDHPGRPIRLLSMCDGDGLPIRVPDGEDYYALADEGILFDSPFDTWKIFLATGRSFDSDQLLYPLDFDRIPTQLIL